MCVSWHGKQCCQREFPTFMYKKIIFHFPSAKQGFFVKQVQRIWLKMPPPLFSYKVDHILWIITEYYEFASFLTNFAHLNHFMSIYRKYVKFELQVHDNLLLIF